MVSDSNVALLFNNIVFFEIVDFTVIIFLGDIWHLMPPKLKVCIIG